jgi:adenosylhomocysteine nucleosidase
MSASIAIIAALPREIAALVRGIRPEAALLPSGIHLYRLPNAIVVAAGMGSLRASIAVEAARAVASIDTLISVGLAGSCVESLAAGVLAEVTTVIDTNTGERFTTSESSQQPYILATIEAIASVHEKSRLSATYGAALVDMEAATVARLAVAHGLRFRAIKAISDAHDFELAALNRFTGKHGTFRTGAFALHTALRPHMWAKAAKLGRDSDRALERLHMRLLEVIASEDLS